MASSTQDNVTLAQGAPTVAVGQTLRTAREVTGKAIEEVAEQLRIRQAFLQALEDGRHRDLPGGTYAVGFLRTYAEFLGLDGEEMVRRFRAEAAGDLNARSELVFPSPVSEGRIPGGAVLFLGLLVAGVVYGAWYFLSSRSAEVAEMVPPLPDRLASALNRPATVTGEAAKTAAETPKAEEGQLKTDEPQAKADESQTAAVPMAAKDGEVVPPAEEEEAKAPAPAAVPAAAPTAPVAVPKADPVKLEAAKAAAPKAEPAKPAPVPAAAVPAATQPATPVAAPAPAAATPPAPAAAPAATAPAAPAPTPVAATTAPVPEGKVIGQEHTDSRIQLKAAADDCWVQVREMDGQLLLSRLLRRGDSYMVPNRPGLTLMVGNAGALEISVDGKKAAPLGATGQVRRDIKLDADKLAAGG